MMEAGVGLEDRLRGLILDSSDGSGAGKDGASNVPLEATTNIPAHEQSAQIPHASPKPPRKRPNQAQRREMAAQLFVPIDTRAEPVVPVRSQHGPGFVGHHHHHRGAGAAGFRGRAREGLATFRPPQQGASASQTTAASKAAPGDHWRGPYNKRDLVPDGQQHHRRPLYNTGRAQQQHQRVYAPPENLEAQVGMLDKLSVMIRADAEIDNSILLEKERFRRSLEELCRDVVYRYEAEQHGLVDFPAQTVELKCFGSLASGFATKASDMDLALVSPFSPIQPDAPGSPIPRLVERAFLEVGVGARLLTRTRVPIIKVCQNPPEKLRADLIAERIKWEKGITETEGHQDDDEPQDDLSNDDQGHTEAVTPAHDHHENQDTSETLHDDKTYAERLEFLRQGKKSLQNYIGQTYKLLRKLGGRDVTPINHGNFTPEEYTILDDVIQAFINGLADEQLKTRLRGYLSLSEYELRKPSKHRTLSSVFTQVEGEIMAMSFATQPVPERDETMQRESQAAYVAWLDIQNQPAFGEDPLQYHKELHAAFLRLQSIPSLQLGVLQQHQYESTFDYYNRTNSIMLRLGGHDEPEPTNGILPLVVRRYVAGIRNKDIREVMEEFLATSGAQSLRAVGRRHKSLQLASDFEKAMTKGIFSDTEEAAVKYYIDWLRRPMVKVSRGPGEWFDFIVPMDTYLAQAVMPVLLRLPDPGELTENKPRDPYHDKLEFPKDGAGVQCDINFSAHLALHNTALLRCYSLTDARVRPLILFVKHWAKVRDINTPYRGTLNSYGYVLMMLHYLVNVAQPFVCPNLQQLAPPPDPRFKGEDGINTQSFCNGANVRFWKDEKEIGGLAAQNVLNGNSDSLGQLLRGFFEYYAQSGFMSMVKGRGFHYGRDVISLRTPGGILTKEQKGWTNAKTVTEVKVIAAPLGSAPPPADPALQSQAATIPASGPIADTPTTSEVKEVRHRYLLAIEDPFELDHNVARTVTHNGIVAIRDEFRRAWRIIQAAGKDEPLEDLLLDAATAEEQRSKGRFVQLLDEIHGQNKGHRLTG